MSSAPSTPVELGQDPAPAAPAPAAPAAPIAAPAELVAAAAAIDGAAAGPPLPAPAAFPSQLAELQDLVQFSVTALAVLYPSLTNVYTPEKIAHLAAALDGVFVKYQWTVTKLGPELNLAIVALPLAAGTYKAIRDDIVTLRAKQAAAAAAARAARTSTPAVNENQAGPPAPAAAAAMKKAGAELHTLVQ